jgi:crotonobetainyl-CoA:carnitine CoA-transferase CaiB-like acyl-CoA transferase
LHGVRILDLTRVLAGPYCTMMLGDMGADVIKVEEPSKGDDTRQWGPPFTASGMSAYFISANRNKRSLTLNLKRAEGMAVLRELVAHSDVLVENFKAGTLEKLGLDYDEMQTLRPGLVYCTITGYGYTGPYKDRPGYDFIVQALGGLMSVTGPPAGEPVRVGVAIADLLTGIYACNAITAALFARERTGEGQRIDVSLLDSQVATLSYVASNYLNSGVAPQRLGNAHPNIVPYQSFEASDGHLAFAAGNDGQWARFCRAAGQDDWIEDERFATNPKRVENRDVLVALLNAVFAERTVVEWLAICEEAGVPAGPINAIPQVFEDPQVLARDMIWETKGKDGETLRMAGTPLKTLSDPPTLRYPPPQHGEHTQEVLAGLLGYDEERIVSLRASGAA